MSKFLGFGSRKLQKKADELMNLLGKHMQVSSAKLAEAVQAWIAKDKDKVDKRVDEIIKIEREADALKEDIIENIFSKRAFLRQSTEERYRLVELLDHVITEVEECALILRSKDKIPDKIPDEMKSLGEMTWKSTDQLQDAIKYMWTDYKESRKYTFKIEKTREKAREDYYDLFSKLINEGYSPESIYYLDRLAKELVEVALSVEAVSDHIRAMTVKYS
ncbi:MAG: DUF47 domain-containing protein [Promethearchaeota archaeon]